MKKLLQFLLTLALMVILTSNAKATGSIIVIDPKTKEVGIAGTSCTYSVYGMAVLSPAKVP